MSVRDYIGLTPCQFFEVPPVRRCLIRFIRKYGGGGGGSTGVQSIGAGTGVTVDNTDPQNPIVSVDTSTIETLYTADGTIPTSRTVTLDNTLSFVEGSGLNSLEVTFNPSAGVITLDVRDLDSAVGLVQISPTSGIQIRNDDPVDQKAGIFLVNSASLSLQVTDQVSQLTNTIVYETTNFGIQYTDLINGNGSLLTHNMSGFSLGWGIGGGISTVFRVNTDGTTEGSASDAPNKFVIQSQVVLNADVRGGQSPFIADGIITQFDITHNLGAVPSYFSLTTTEPIASNHLQRTITFPDNDTMRLTFALAPSVGQDANYVWIVYR